MDLPLIFSRTQIMWALKCYCSAAFLKRLLVQTAATPRVDADSCNLDCFNQGWNLLEPSRNNGWYLLNTIMTVSHPSTSLAICLVLLSNTGVPVLLSPSGVWGVKKASLVKYSYCVFSYHIKQYTVLHICISIYFHHCLASKCHAVLV